MKRILLLLLSFGLSAQLAFSQAEEVVSAVKKINSIKSDSKYLYAESTTSDWEQAYENAKALLSVEIDNWVSMQKNASEAQGYVAKIENNFMEVKTRRGNLFRVFVYIKKDNIMPYTENDELMVSKISQDGQTTAQGGQTTGKQDSVQAEQPSESAEQPSVSAKPATTPAEPVAVAEAEAEKPKATKTTKSEKSKMESTVEPLYTLNEKDKNFLTLNTVNGIEGYLKEHASNYGKLASIPADTDFYILIFAKSKIIAHLLHRSEAPDINLDTLQEDKLDNYRGKGWGAIWIFMK